MKNVCYLLFIVLLASCGANKEEVCKILMTGTVTGKYTNSDYYVWSDPDGGDMTTRAKFVILNDKDTFEYKGIYPRQPILLFRNARRSDVRIGDTASIVQCKKDVILVKASNVHSAIADYRHEQKFGWWSILSFFMFLAIPVALVLLWVSLIWIFKWDIEDDNTGIWMFLICLVAGIILASILQHDIGILLAE